MSTSTLSAHSSRFQSQLVTLDHLRTLPEPEVLGRLHKPVPHHQLVEALRQEATRRGYDVGREQLALSKTGAALFGVLDLTPRDAAGLTPAQRGQSFGFRNATDQQFGLRAVAGSRVFVCDNLCLSGDLIALSRKNTTRLDLGEAIALGFDRFAAHSAQLEVQVLRLEATAIDDDHAKRIVYDLFAARVMPARLFDDVHRFYFEPTDARPDCQPRSLWGLHNACTRAVQDLNAVRGFGALSALGRAFELWTREHGEAPIIDVEGGEGLAGE